jgi:hypothetical protein
MRKKIHSNNEDSTLLKTIFTTSFIRASTELGPQRDISNSVQAYFYSLREETSFFVAVHCLASRQQAAATGDREIFLTVQAYY